MTDPMTPTDERWLGPGVAGIGTASFLADVGHEIPTALPPNLFTATLGAPVSALGLIEGISDGLAGAGLLGHLLQGAQSASMVTVRPSTDALKNA